MGNRIGDILKEFTGIGGKDKIKEDSLKDLLKFLNNAGFKVEGITQVEVNKDDDKECDCFGCFIKKNYDDAKFWAADKIKCMPKYKMMEIALTERVGDNLGDWIELLAGNIAHFNDSTKELNDAIREVEMCKIAKQIISENIERLTSKGDKH
jgi:hypothetical protein